MSKQREELDSALEALQNEMRQIISKLSLEEMVWIHQPVVGVVPVCVSPPSREPIGTIVGWYSGYPMIKLFSDGWIPAVGTVLYSAPKPDAMTHIGYMHPYGIEQLPIYAERGEKWNTPVSSTPFDGAIKVYVRVE